MILNKPPNKAQTKAPTKIFLIPRSYHKTPLQTSNKTNPNLQRINHKTAINQLMSALTKMEVKRSSATLTDCKAVMKTKLRLISVL